MSKRVARVGEMIRRIVASELEQLDDDRLLMVSITEVDVDRALYRAVVWFTTLDGDAEAEAAEALLEHSGVLRKAVSSRTRMRHTPLLEFRPDLTLRSAQRIEEILREDRRRHGD
ncbi:MAG: 30S ribosome-binding factor RbfA [Acidimicrobiia bacterium]|nr:30S ribosome-binding factor RbfA [Acidimicrobiia bacterium]MCY4456855.1 30S ribosome-binding factor RbfA [Acidimicrobiaceae bacterium]